MFYHFGSGAEWAFQSGALPHQRLCRKEDTELKDKVWNAIKEMKEDGTLKEISEKWFGSDLTVVE